ncbi:acetylornithine deacetylase [Acidisoma cellulosilytica]|uniref:Acetylornithine deacetylase n=1 Tax=Acidisoma cellulosilyticum TaxID=2802395 RepID=A0A963Z2J3_9PROT|nr:acetylornithine deacetylase [Acidisoma cellulosilyticum]MCB8881336.1 acetylornithine deacetylase [Acidisoma cellulosilyticum]
MNELEILARLVSFDTTSRNSNLPLIDFIRDYLLGLGIASVIIPDATGTKANLFATIGPADQPGILLSGHTDVVPVDGQSWRSDPFELTRDGDRVFGRGVADMKGFLACALAMVPQFQTVGLRRPIHLAFSYDEEVGCYGVPGILAHMQAQGLQPQIAFVGEPSLMKIVTGHKGSCGLRTSVQGLAYHSSRTDLGVNAIFHAAELLAWLQRRATMLAGDAAEQAPFDPPYSTIGVGVIRGGIARNTVADLCSFDWDIRATRPRLVGEIVGALERFAQETVLPVMRRGHAGSAIVTEIAYDVPPLLPQSDSPAEQLGKLLAQRNDTATVAYGSEAGFFQGVGISTTICGPGSIDQAHAADEWISVDQLRSCMGFLGRLDAYARGG